MPDQPTEQDVIDYGRFLQGVPVGSTAIPNVTDLQDFLARTGRAASSSLDAGLQGLAKFEGNQTAEDYFRTHRLASGTNEPGDLTAINPENNDTFLSGLAEGIGGGVPKAGLLALTGGAGLGLLAGEGALGAYATTSDAQKAYDEAAAEAIARGEEPVGERPSMIAEQAKSAGSLAAFAALGPLAGKLGMPLVAKLPFGFRTAGGIAATTAGNIAADTAIRTGINAATGKPLMPFESPKDLGAGFGGALAFSGHGGYEMGKAVPEFLRQRREAKIREENVKLLEAKKAELEAIRAAQPKTVVKPTSETPGLQVDPAKAVEPLTPTTQPGTPALLPNSTTQVEATSIKPPELQVTPPEAQITAKEAERQQAIQTTLQDGTKKLMTGTERRQAVAIAEARISRGEIGGLGIDLEAQQKALDKLQKLHAEITGERDHTEDSSERTTLQHELVELENRLRELATGKTQENAKAQAVPPEPVPPVAPPEPIAPPVAPKATEPVARLAEIQEEMRGIEEQHYDYDKGEIKPETPQAIKDQYAALEKEHTQLARPDVATVATAPVIPEGRPDVTKAPPPFTTADEGATQTPYTETLTDKPNRVSREGAVKVETLDPEAEMAALRKKVLDDEGDYRPDAKPEDVARLQKLRAAEVEKAKAPEPIVGEEPVTQKELEALSDDERAAAYAKAKEAGNKEVMDAIDAIDEKRALEAEDIPEPEVATVATGARTVDEALRKSGINKDNEYNALAETLDLAQGDTPEQAYDRNFRKRDAVEIGATMANALADARGEARPSNKTIKDASAAMVEIRKALSSKIRDAKTEPVAETPVRPEPTPIAEAKTETKPGLTPAEEKELAALWKKKKHTKADEDRIDALQERLPDLGASVQGIRAASKTETVEDIAKKKGVDKSILQRATDYVNQRLLPQAQKLASAIAGENVTKHILDYGQDNFMAAIDKDGDIHIVSHPVTGARFRAMAGSSDLKASAVAKKYLSEELIHVAQLTGIRDIWRAMDPATRGPADVFATEYVRKIAEGTLAHLRQLRQDGDQITAAKIDSAVRAARRQYDESQDVPLQTGAQLLDQWSKNPDEAYKYILELDRQLHQLRKSPSTTESFMERVLNPLTELTKSAIRALKRGLGLAESGELGKSFQELYDNTKRNLENKEIKTRVPDLPEDTLAALKGLNVTYNGVQEGFKHIPAVNLFTSNEPGRETTFATPLGATKEEVQAARDRALLPFNERAAKESAQQRANDQIESGAKNVTPEVLPEGTPQTNPDNAATDTAGRTPESGGPAVEGGQLPSGPSLGARSEGAPIKQGGKDDRPILDRAYDSLKKLTDSKIVGRLAERLKPAVRELRSQIDDKFRGLELTKNNAATKVRTGIDLAFRGNKEDMDAAYVVLEQGGARIGEDGAPTREEVLGYIGRELQNAKKALASDNIPDSAKEVIKKWVPAYERAIEKFDDIAPKTKRVRDAFDEAYQLRQTYDPDARFTEDYVSRVYELNKERGNSPLPPESLIGGGRSGISSFDKSRKYDSIMDAMIGRKTENGGWEHETPKSLNVADLAANHTAVTNDIVGNKILNDTFETTSYPGTHEPVFVPRPKVGDSLPPNYVRLDGPFKQPVFVYKPIADLFKSIYDESAVRKSDIGNALLKTAGVLKHGTLLLDFFHTSRTGQKAFFEALASGDWNRVKDFKKDLPSYTDQGQMGKYLAQLNLDPRDIPAALEQGRITERDAEYMRTQGPITERQAKDGGLLAGRFTDNLWKDAEGFMKSIAKKIGPQAESVVNGIGDFNKFTFDRLTKSAMLAVFEARRARIEKDFPELTEIQKSRKAAKEVNEQFGNIGRAGLFKSKTAQDFAQIFMLAPQWVQSQIMAEARSYGQGARAVFDATVGKKLPNGERERVLRVGNSARFLAQTALSVFLLNQGINIATRGKPTWDNEEEGHKMDAWIPSVTGGPGFFYSPWALASEYRHQLGNYTKYESTPSAIAHIASNKLSPMASAAKVALTQKDYMGNKLTPGQTALATARQLVPVPILASSAIKGFDPASKKGTTQFNLTKSAGVTLDKAPDKVAQAYQSFAPYRGKERPDTGPSPYRDLKTLVQNDSGAQSIKQEVDRLVKEGKKKSDILKSFEFKPLSGSAVGDIQALKELGKEGLRLYNAAKAQKMAEKQAYLRAINSK